MQIEGKTGTWELVIGLEVHAQVVSNAKLFSGAATDFGSEPNTQVSFVDAAFPGMLPVINRVCVEQAIKTGLGINGTVNEVSIFDRKNYFYPDLPAGYQISQFTRPIVSNGRLAIELDDGKTKDIGVTRLHMEQDAGKSLHDQSATKTYVDLNRSGIALMEIVSEPDIRSPEEAGAYLRKLRSILRYLGTCDGNMEEGSMRSKEQAHDYRYFPDPDLLPLVLDPKLIEDVRKAMPELPDAKRDRFIRDFKLSPYDSSVLVAEQENAAFFEEVVKGRKDPKLAANWVISELFGVLNKQSIEITKSPVSAKALAGMLDLLENNTISGRIAKDVFQIMVETGKDAAAIVEEKGLKQVTDTGAIDAAIAKVMAASADKVADYRAGKVALFGWFVGQVMKATQGKANPAMVNEILKKKLAG